jgi:hypothetical protein
MNRLSKLQKRILAELGLYGPIENVNQFAKTIRKHRSSVSRSLHSLQACKLIERTPRGWQNTMLGWNTIKHLWREPIAIAWHWSNDSVGFDCVCGEEIIMDSEEPKRCGCGLEYKLVYYLQTKGLMEHRTWTKK